VLITGTLNGECFPLMAKSTNEIDEYLLYVGCCLGASLKKLAAILTCKCSTFFRRYLPLVDFVALVADEDNDRLGSLDTENILLECLYMVE